VQPESELQRYVSPPAVSGAPPEPTAYATEDPGVREISDDLAYAPPPPPPAPLAAFPPPPPPMTSIVLSEEFQSYGTVHELPEVR
jgi:hypothetical protein